MPGRFIVIEGLDGCGKGTQCKLLKKHLEEKGGNVILTVEPTDGPIGKEIREVLGNKKEISADSLQELFVKDRTEHLEKKIEPALAEGKIVICDRYTLSTIAYGGLEDDMEKWKKMNADFRKPDLTIIVDASPEVCLKRLSDSREHIEIFERLEKLKKVRENYLKLKGFYHNTHVIDGSRTKEEVFEEIKKLL